MSNNLNLFIIAGEESGDRLGGALMQGLARLSKRPIQYSGVGGRSMHEQGLQSLFNISDLSVMGLLEVLPRLPKLMRRIRQTANAIDQTKPDAIITIDSPDFCLRVLARIKEKHPDIPIIHYVAPSVWAWRPERAQKMAVFVDHVLALLPFEPPLMQDAGMSCDFVGHPTAATQIVDDASQKGFIQQFGLDGRVITLLPGSRSGEIKRMMPILGEVASKIQNTFSDAKFILPLADNVVADVNAALQSWQVKPILLMPEGEFAKNQHQKNTAFAVSDLAIATSGTVALELAAQSCPMVIAYKANWMTTRMVKKMAQIDTANLINILTNSRVIPEFLFENCDAELIASQALTLLQNPDAKGEQKNAMRDAMQSLLPPGVDINVAPAQSVLDFLERKNGL